MATLFTRWTAGFAGCPCSIASERSVVCPVELWICLTVKSQPCAVAHDFLLPCKEVVDKLIFGSGGDFSEVTTQLLAVPSCIAPLQRWDVNDEVTWLAKSNPAGRTPCFCWKVKRLKKKRLQYFLCLWKRYIGQVAKHSHSECFPALKLSRKNKVIQRKIVNCQI